MKYDVFISHASEDKDTLVRGLAEVLRKLSVKVWYDEFSLKLGDSLSESIDKGLVNSEYGVVVLSKDFLNKGWTSYELKSLITKEVGKKKVILPIWHNIEKAQIEEVSLYLADKLAIDSKNKNYHQIAMEICRVVKPEIYNNLMRRITYEKIYAIKKGVEYVELEVGKEDKEKLFPMRHKGFSKSLINRMLLLKDGFKGQFNMSDDEVIEGFLRDTNPDREVEIWESVLFTTNRVVEKFKLDNFERISVEGLVLFISLEEDIERVKEYYSYIDNNIIEYAWDIFKECCPYEHTQMVRLTENKK